MSQSLHVFVDGKNFVVEVAEDEDGLFVRLSDGRTKRIETQSRLAQSVQKMRIDDDLRSFAHRKTVEGHELVIDGAVLTAVVKDARAVQYAGMVKPPAGANRAIVKAPMPGLAVTVLVKFGDTVAKDQTLLTLNAMKLENDIRSPVAGVVSEVNITPGQAVEKGFSMVVVE